MTEQTFNHPQVYVVLVVTKARGQIRRIDSVHAQFATAALRQSTMFLQPSEGARVVAKTLVAAGEN